MKQIFVALVLINLGYPLLQRLFGVDQADVHAVSEAEFDTFTETSEAVDASVIKFIEAPHYDGGAEDGLAVAASVPGLRPNLAATSELEPRPSPEHQTSPVSDSSDPQESPVSDNSDPQEVAGSGAGSCVIAGPFRQESEARALVKQLAATGIDSVVQPRDPALLPDYMVYVGPESSDADARALEAKFAARKMDSHVIARGDLRNALSLGVFSRAALADFMRQKLRAEGFDANIVPMTRNRRGLQVLTSLPGPVRARLLEADIPMIDCPAVDPKLEV